MWLWIPADELCFWHLDFCVFYTFHNPNNRELKHSKMLGDQWRCGRIRCQQGSSTSESTNQPLAAPQCSCLSFILSISQNTLNEEIHRQVLRWLVPSTTPIIVLHSFYLSHLLTVTLSPFHSITLSQFHTFTLSNFPNFQGLHTFTILYLYKFQLLHFRVFANLARDAHRFWQKWSSSWQKHQSWPCCSLRLW